MLRVAYLTDKLIFDGTPLQMMELALHLDRQKFQPHFVVLSRVEPKLRERLEARQIGIDLIGRANWVRPEALAGVWKLYRAFKRIQPHIVHAYLATSNVLGALVGKMAGVPMTISSQRDLGGFDGKRIAAANGWTDRWLTDCVTANSRAVRDAWANRSGLRAESVKLLYNGIDIEKINHANRGTEKRQALGLSSTDLVIAVVATLAAAKGHLYLVEAFTRLARRFPNAKLLLCGYCNDTQLLNTLRRLVVEAGAENQVWFMGSRPDIPEIVHTIDILVAPSLSEGFSNSILEAMAAGKPIVASRVGGNCEQVLDGVTGCLVPPADSGAIEKALDKLLSSAELRQQMGSAAADRVREHFSVEKMVEEHERLYCDLLRNKRRS
jgi:glycosyltransferase involved in cell wall biosynthesis